MAGGPFMEAYSTVQNVEQIVEQRVDAASQTAAALQTTALQTVSALGNVNLNFSAGSPPALPDIDPTINVDLDLPSITPTSFGSITSNTPNVPSLDPVPSIPTLVIPDFVSSVSSLNTIDVASGRRAYGIFGKRWCVAWWSTKSWLADRARPTRSR